MIGTSSPLPPLCLSCGIELSDSDVNDDGACAECFAESQAKAIRQLEKERADQFQWLSGEWFTERSPLALERRAEQQWEANNADYYGGSNPTFLEQSRMYERRM
jgi:hypothetical protein